MANETENSIISEILTNLLKKRRITKNAKIERQEVMKRNRKSTTRLINLHISGKPSDLRHK